ncbi:MAG: class I SAM-dependent methyltransferase [Candidatus Methanoperedens sp.]
MNITFIDKLRTLLKVYGKISKLPKNQQILTKIINPIDTTRYTEFAYLLKFIKNRNLRKMNILDISSPFMMSYILASENKVLKTDINIEEKSYINETINLSFKLEDAAQLSFKDNTFDLIYSISVIEHIYNKYIQAINEMIRVVKKDGYIYLTFPVSFKHVEEWCNTNIYSHQYKENSKTFFQYRFGESDLNNIFESLKNVEVIDMSIYWEKNNGQYDKTMLQIKKQLNNKYLTLIKNSFINFIWGFNLLENKPGDFKSPKLFGNVSLVLKKNRCV